MPQKLNVSDKIGSVSLEINNARNPKYTLVLAHGAGAGMHHPFMFNLAENVSGMDGNVIRFNFPYIEQGRKSPGSPKPNIECIRTVAEYAVTHYSELPVFLAGKSYGGRMSSHLIAEHDISIPIRGLVYFGFPLHAPGRDSKDRALHLRDVSIPQLFMQGTNDKLASLSLIREVIGECQAADLIIVDHGDHSFKVPKKLTGQTADDVLVFLADQANEWMLKQL